MAWRREGGALLLLCCCCGCGSLACYTPAPAYEVMGAGSVAVDGVYVRLQGEGPAVVSHPGVGRGVTFAI